MPISRRQFVLGSLALPAFAAKTPPSERPNVVLILVDNLPEWMVGAFGNKEIHTPQIDHLTLTGTRFINHFAAAPTPVAGYSTLVTGRTPMQIGDTGAPGAADATLDKLLGPAGYACHTTDRQDGSEVTAAAEKFINQQAAGKPFLLTVHYTDLTPPYSGTPAKFVEMYANQNFDTYPAGPLAANSANGKELMSSVAPNLRKAAAAISAIDDNVGRLIAALTSKRLLDDTVVVFTATCGGLYGHHGLWGTADASEPPNMFDETVATPLIWRWPRRIPPQGLQVEMVSAYDLVPSLCDLLSIPVPGRNLCGRSYIPIAQGKKLPKKQPWRTIVCAHHRGTDMAREQRYKLVLTNGGKGPNELYDLSVDAAETTNQFDNQQYLDVKNRLNAEVTKWKQNYSS